MTTQEAKVKLEIVKKLEENAWQELEKMKAMIEPSEKTWHNFYEQRVQLETYIKFNETNP